MHPLFNRLTAAAKLLNQEFIPCEQWEQKVRDSAQPEALLRQAIKVLEGERSGVYFNPRHYRQTNPEKLSLSYRQCRLLSELIGRVFPQRLEMDGRDSLLDGMTASAIDHATKGVIDDGIVELPTKLSSAVIGRIQSSLADLPFACRVTKEERSGIHGDSRLHGAWWLNDTDKISEIQEVQDLALDPTILSIAQGVLGTMPIHVQTNAWWTFPCAAAPGESLERIQKRNAQWFHQDMEFIDFVKVFVYLSDVGASNGPHVYVRGSANDYEERLPGIKVSDRVSDEAIRNAFGPERVYSATGPAGTILIANTRGYHKGAPVVEGHRLLLQFEYTCSMYFNPVAAFPIHCLTPSNQRLRQQSPRMFLNYRNAAVPAVGYWQNLVSRFTRRLPMVQRRAA